MDLFLSTFENRIDAKGRLSVPAPYRAVLERTQSALYIFPSLTSPCLEGCGAHRIQQIVHAIEQKDSMSDEVGFLQDWLSRAQEMKIDADGRISIPAHFITHAGIETVALFAGVGRAFQIWHPEQYKARATKLRAHVAEHGMPNLTLATAGQGGA